MDAHERLVRLLDSRGAEFRLIHHARPLGCGVVRCAVVSVSRPGRTGHVLTVVPGGRRVAMGALRALWPGSGAFPVPDEVAEALTGGVPVPFSWRPDLAVVADRRLVAEREIVFAAPRPGVSIGLATIDYLRLARPSVADIARTFPRSTPLAEAA